MNPVCLPFEWACKEKGFPPSGSIILLPSEYTPVDKRGKIIFDSVTSHGLYPCPLTLTHSKWSILNGVITILSAVGLRVAVWFIWFSICHKCWRSWSDPGLWHNSQLKGTLAACLALSSIEIVWLGVWIMWLGKVLCRCLGLDHS